MAEYLVFLLLLRGWCRVVPVVVVVVIWNVSVVDDNSIVVHIVVGVGIRNVSSCVVNAGLKGLAV